MLSISYCQLMTAITLLWILFRAFSRKKLGQFHWKRELQLLLVYICIVVVTRFTFFPFSKVNGQVQPLVFDAAKMYPFRINLLPFVYLTDYPTQREILLNFIGNTAMFIPLGVVWPAVYKELNTHTKAISAGIGCSLLIEVLQLPFFGRVTDIDDLILNSVGYLLGYGLYLLIIRVKLK